MAQTRFNARLGLSVGSTPTDVIDSTGNAIFTQVTVGSNTQASPQLFLNGTAATGKYIQLQSAGVARWNIASLNAETGSNNGGSDLYIGAYNDAGSLIDYPLGIPRAVTGTVTTTRPFAAKALLTGQDNSLIALSLGRYSAGVPYSYIRTMDTTGGSNHSTAIVFQAGDGTVIANLSTLSTLAGTLNLYHTTPSTSPTTGALVVSGGLGVSGMAWFGGETVVKTANPVFTMSGNKAGGNTWSVQSIDADGRFRIYDTTNSNEPLSIVPGVSGEFQINRPLSVSGSYVTIQKDLSVGDDNASQHRWITLTAPSGKYKGFSLETSNSQRWLIASNAVAESGSNVGSNLEIDAYDDSGTLIDAPVTINRASGGAISLVRNTYIGNDTTATSLNLNGPNNSLRYIYFRTAGTSRWGIGTEINETGSDVGSNFYISAINDAGAYIDSPIIINRAASSAIVFNRPLSLSASLGFQIVSGAPGVTTNKLYNVGGSLYWNGSTVGGLSNPMTTSGDMIYGGTSGTPTRLIGNGTDTRKFLTSTGSGAVTVRNKYTSSGKVQTGVSVVIGDLIIVGLTIANSLQTASCADDAAGGTNTYNQVGTGAGYSPGGVEMHMFYAIAKATETLTITCTSSNSNSPGIFVHVVSGCNQTLGSVLDVYNWDAVEGSASTAHTSASITTTNADDYIIVFWSQNYAGGTFSENGTGFTEELENASGYYGCTYNKSVDATGTYSDTVTTTSSMYVGNVIAAFKAAGSIYGGANPPEYNTLASSDLTSALTTPPAIGATTPNTGRFTTLLGGTATDFSYYTNSKVVVKNGSVVSSGNTTSYGIVAESNSGTTGSVGIHGVAKSVANSPQLAIGVYGLAYPGDTAHTCDVIGVSGGSYTAHTGGKNIGVHGSASGGLTNYSFYGSTGVLHNADATASTSTSTGSITTLGGLGIALDAYIGGKLNLASKAATTVAGDFWNDSTQNSLSTYISGASQKISGVLWTKTSTTTLASWTTAATIIGAVGTGVGTLTVPANLLKIGKTIRLRLKGVLSTTTTAPTLNVAVTLGGVSLGNTGANSLTTVSMSGKAWALDVEITCRTTGSSGTVACIGAFTVCNSATLSYCWGLGLGTGTATVNTTTDLAINVTAACGTSNASNSMSCVTAVVEILN